MKPRPGAAPQFFKQLGDDFLCGNFLEQPLLDLLAERTGMLKITTYDNRNRTVLELDGKLVGPWVNSHRLSRNFFISAVPGEGLKTVGQVVGTNEIFLRWKGEM